MKNICFLCLALSISLSACAQQDESSVKAEDPVNINYTLENVVTDMEIPWGMTFLPDGSLLATEKSGTLYHIIGGQKTKVEGLPEIYQRGQGGLLDLELHPNFQENKWLYFTYASPVGDGDGGNTAISRAKFENNTLTDVQVIYKAGPNTKKGQHFGSRIAFDNDGYLYFSVGDRGNRDENPQDITRDGGKIYRLHDDGRIPEDNPFVNKANAKKAVYSYGHRNPQGMTKHPVTGEIWVHEHGPQGGDEINIIQKGKNFGWPLISYGINYNGTSFTENTSLPGMEQPLFYWVPSIAPSGMAVVSSDKYPDWKGNVLAGSLKFQYVERLIIEGGAVVKREKLFESSGRIRSIEEAPDGFIYVGVENKGIFKIVPSN